MIKAELYPEIAPNTVNNFISLINHNFYDGVIFHLSLIHIYFAFSGCSSLTSIVIPKNVRNVGVGVFQNDRNLSYCEIKNPNLEEFGNGSFDDCEKLKTVEMCIRDRSCCVCQ